MSLHSFNSALNLVILGDILTSEDKKFKRSRLPVNLGIKTSPLLILKESKIKSAEFPR